MDDVVNWDAVHQFVNGIFMIVIGLTMAVAAGIGIWILKQDQKGKKP